MPIHIRHAQSPPPIRKTLVPPHSPHTPCHSEAPRRNLGLAHSHPPCPEPSPHTRDLSWSPHSPYPLSFRGSARNLGLAHSHPPCPEPSPHTHDSRGPPRPIPPVIPRLREESRTCPFTSAMPRTLPPYARLSWPPTPIPPVIPRLREESRTCPFTSVMARALPLNHIDDTIIP